MDDAGDEAVIDALRLGPALPPRILFRRCPHFRNIPPPPPALLWLLSLLPSSFVFLFLGDCRLGDGDDLDDGDD